MGRIHIYFCFLLWFFPALVLAQEIKPVGEFLKDSVMVGAPVEYSFRVKYPKSMETLFPDSTYDFSPFEFVRKDVFNTLSDTAQSYDSVIYHLVTFELDEVQSLALPIYLIIDGDSTEVYSEKDSISFKTVIAENLDSLALLKNTDHQEVARQFNYPYLVIGIVAVLLVIGILIALFGRGIYQRIQIARLKKAHQRFLQKFDRLRQEEPMDTYKVEHIVAVWKKYLERLENFPYSKLTTKEILTIEQNRHFKETLKSLDRNIYDRLDAVHLVELFDNLQDFGQQRFTQRLERIGK